MSNLSNAKLSGRANSPERLKSIGYHVTSPAPREVWRELFQNDPEALPTQSPEWLDCICALRSGRDASRLYEFSDGQQLVLPAISQRGLPNLPFLASLPDSWGWGGVLVERLLGAEHLRAVFEEISGRLTLSTHLCPNPRQGELWRAAQPKDCVSIPRCAHVLDLEGGFDHVWKKRFVSKTRNQVRRAEKSSLVVECDTTGRLIPIFHELFRRSVDRWAEQQHEPRWLARWRAEQRDPLRKLEHIAQHMGKVCNVWVAWQGDRPAAACLVMYGSNADYMMSAMDKELAAPTNANDLLQKHAIEKACRLGCRYYHMGESGPWKGVAHFKERFGAEPYTYNAYRWESLPLSKLDRGLRSVVKRAIGFKDA